MPRRRAQNGRRLYDYHCEMPMSVPTVPEMLAQLVAEVRSALDARRRTG